MYSDDTPSPWRPIGAPGLFFCSAARVRIAEVSNTAPVVEEAVQLQKAKHHVDNNWAGSEHRRETYWSESFSPIDITAAILG